jgi:putative peptidoglycan binding protein
MRIIWTVIACLGLASIGAARDDDQNQKNKKGGSGNPQPQQSAAPKGEKHFDVRKGPIHPQGTQTYTPHNDLKIGNKSQLHTYDKTTELNKTTTINKNVTVNKNVNVNKNFKFEKKHFDLHTNVVNNKYKKVAFNQNYKIAGAYKWKGPKYQVFVNYHPEWHDQYWWHQHHNHIVFIFGGWYYWDNDYWYPAWGYAPESVYYYDGPIYASNPEEDPGQVVANVQSALQEQGYYQGDIDGILGPQTRAALAEFQSAQGLEPTGAVDEPTLETLGMA